MAKVTVVGSSDVPKVPLYFKDSAGEIYIGHPDEDLLANLKSGIMTQRDDDLYIPLSTGQIITIEV